MFPLGKLQSSPDLFPQYILVLPDLPGKFILRIKWKIIYIRQSGNYETYVKEKLKYLLMEQNEQED